MTKSFTFEVDETCMREVLQRFHERDLISIQPGPNDSYSELFLLPLIDEKSIYSKGNFQIKFFDLSHQKNI